jgi:hypothetical protein
MPGAQDINQMFFAQYREVSGCNALFDFPKGMCLLEGERRDNDELE